MYRHSNKDMDRDTSGNRDIRTGTVTENGQ
jgi:hypothetical protein